MKVLVIGGSGFVSGNMVRGALAAGHEVWGLSRGNKPVPDGATPLVADRHDHGTFAQVIDGANVRWDLVIDCIGFNAEDAQQDVEVFAERADHLVFISTDCVNSPVKRPWCIDETFDRFDTAPYGANKRAAEEVLLATDPKRLPLTILRPGHIYGPGSQLGCLPLHGRDPELLRKMQSGEALKLVGGGHFLQQPVFVRDLVAMALSCHGNERAHGQVYLAPGPDVIASWRYYDIIAEHLGVGWQVAEASIASFLEANPTMQNFCCHRAYSNEKAKTHGLAVPATSIVEGLKEHVTWLLSQQ